VWSTRNEVNWLFLGLTARKRRGSKRIALFWLAIPGPGLPSPYSATPNLSTSGRELLRPARRPRCTRRSAGFLTRCTDGVSIRASRSAAACGSGLIARQTPAIAKETLGTGNKKAAQEGGFILSGDPRQEFKVLRTWPRPCWRRFSAVGPDISWRRTVSDAFTAASIAAARTSADA